MLFRSVSQSRYRFQWNDDANWIQPPPGTTGIRRLNTNPNEPDPRSQTLIFTVANQDSYSVNYSALPSAQQLTFPALTNAAWFQVRSADGKSLRPGAYILRNLITGRQTAAQIRGCNTNRLLWTLLRKLNLPFTVMIGFGKYLLTGLKC